MEENVEKIFAKYSKLVEDNPKKDNETQETMDKQKAEKLVLAWFENDNPPNTKEKQVKIGLKTLVGIALVFLMIVTGLVAGLIILDMKIKQLEHQNENLVQNLRSQETISHDLNAQNQNLSTNLEDMTNALVVSEFEIGDLKEEIKNLIGENQKLIVDFESKHQSLEHYQKLHQNCTKEQELGRDLIKDLKLQNQNLTKDLGSINSTKESLKNLISDEFLNQELLKASKNGKIDQVRLVLDLGANVNATNDFKNTSLHFAAIKGHLEVVKLLLQHGADCNAKDSNMSSPLHYAILNGSLELTELLLQNRAAVDAKMKGQFTPLHVAAFNGDFEIAELLLQNGADVNAKDFQKRTPLHLAAGYGKPKTVKILLKYGARKDVKDYYDYTPLDDAKYYERGDYQQVIELLQNS